MSARIQTFNSTATTTGFLNVYRQTDGKIKFESKVYRQRVNAERAGRENVGPSTYLRTMAVTAEHNA